MTLTAPSPTLLLTIFVVTGAVFTPGCACDIEPDASSCESWDALELPASNSTPPDGATKLLRSPDKIYTGFYNIGDVEAGLTAFNEKSDGVSPAIVFTFHDWNVGGDALRDFNAPMEGEEMSPLEMAEAAFAQGSILAVSWAAIDYYIENPAYWLGVDTRNLKHADILAGDYDDYIRRVATQIRESGVPIMLSAFGEIGVVGVASYGADAYQLATSVDDVCRNYGDPGWPDGPERARDIHRHVVDLFRAENVTNVTWFMYMSTGYMNPAFEDSWEHEHPGYYYPGEDYVDWIGASAYFTDDDTLHKPELEDLNFALEDAVAAWGEVTDKPFFVPEFGIVGRKNESRAAQITSSLEDGLPALGVDAFALGDAPLFEALFEIPLLGTTDDELDAWVEATTTDLYSSEVLLSQ